MHRLSNPAELADAAHARLSNRAASTFPNDKTQDVPEGKVANMQRAEFTFRKMPVRHLLKKRADVVVLCRD
jgi:hypothetical protein